MSVKWTASQDTAIHTPIGKTIVSAGAGSGKTAVLTERVIQHVLNGHSIQDFLIVTFTKAAALEMKERIRSHLQTLLDAGHPELSEALLGLDLAHISTFDSFSLFIVQTYGHLIGLSPNVSIADAIYIDQQKHALIDVYFDDLHTEGDEAFLTVLKTYSTKSPNRVKQMVLTLADAFLKKGILTFNSDDLATYYAPEHLDRLAKEYENLVKEKCEDARALADILVRSVFEPDKHAFALTVKAALDPVMDASQADEVHQALKALKWPSKPKKLFTDEDEPFNSVFDDLKDHIKKLTVLTEEPLEVALKNILNQRPLVETMVRLADGFNHRYLEAQKQRGLFDFQTMAVLSLSILRDHQDALNGLKDSFKEILIDEYQDTSPLQDKIIECLETNNVYIVGDIKQSIYRFRDASPELFQDKYHAFPSAGGTRIELSENFRSRSSVIESINALFKATFDARLGGIDYTDGQPLKFGLENYHKASHPDLNVGMNVITYDEADLELFKDVMPYTSDADQAMYVESLYTARAIKKAITDAMPIYDKSTNELRPAKLSDFVILMDRKTRFDVIQDAFNAEKVPIYAHKEEQFISHTDVLVTINLFKLFLSLTDASRTKDLFKHSFLSVAYSYLLDVTQDDIIAFMLELDTLHPKRIFEVSKDTPFDPFFAALKKRVDAFEITPLDRLLTLFNTDFKLLEKGLSLGHFKATEERYLFIESRLKEFASRGDSLHDWVDYLDYTLSHNDPSNPFFSLDMDYVQGTKLMDDTVNVMSIHKSKGLEFPRVFYLGLSARLRTGDRELIAYSKHYGIIMDLFDEGLKPSLSDTLHQEASRLDDLSEKLRVFYVALTRARESLTLFIPRKDTDLYLQELSDKVPLTFRKRMKSYKALMQLSDGALNTKRSHITLDEAFFKSDMAEATDDSIQPASPLTYQTYQGLSKERADSRYSVEQTMWMEASTVQAIDTGNLLHDAFEHIDFHGDIDAQIESLGLDETMQAHLRTFFNHATTQSLITDRVFKEIPFTEETSDGLRRGIIDLVFENDDHFTVVDYKLKTTDKAGYIDQVKGYVAYLEKRLNKPGKGYLYSIQKGTYDDVL